MTTEELTALRKQAEEGTSAVLWDNALYLLDEVLSLRRENARLRELIPRHNGKTLSQSTFNDIYAELIRSESKYREALDRLNKIRKVSDAREA